MNVRGRVDVGRGKNGRWIVRKGNWEGLNG